MQKITAQLTGNANAEDVIRTILAAAKAAGLDQAQLAARAGISAESLSRLKKNGNCRFATALRLARAAGFTSLELLPGPLGSSALTLAALKLSAGRPKAIAEAELLSALRRGAVRPRQKAHLIGFFEELPIELLHAVALDEGLDYRRLLQLAKDLDAEGESLDWLAEMAGDGLAPAA